MVDEKQKQLLNLKLVMIGLDQEIKNIQIQLSDPNRMDRDTGKRMIATKYQSWRFTALRAINDKQQRMAEMQKQRIKLQDEVNGSPACADLRRIIILTADVCRARGLHEGVFAELIAKAQVLAKEG